MPSRLPQQIRQHVIRQWICGALPAQIAARANISEGTVRNILRELRSRSYPDYETFLPYLDDLRRLHVQLSAHEHSLQNAIDGITIFDALTELGIEPAELAALIESLRRITPPEFPIEQFARATLRITRLESEYRLTYHELEANVPKLSAKLASLAAEKKRLEDAVAALQFADEEERQKLESSLEETRTRFGKEIQTLESNLEHLRKENSAQLQSNRTTKEQLDRYLAIQRRLVAKRIDIEKLGVLEGIIIEFEKYGWQAHRIITYLGQIQNLELQKRQADIELSKTQTELDERKADLQTMAKQVTQKTTELHEVQGLETESQQRTAALNEQMEKDVLKIDLADMFLTLLNDPAKVQDAQILRSIELMGQIVKTRAAVKGYPIDYGSLRQQMHFLLEAVLGKELVPRDFMEEQTMALKNLNSELLLGRWVKLEGERSKLHREKMDIISERKKLSEEKAAFWSASRDKLLAVVAGLSRSREIHVLVCTNCGFRQAHQLGSISYVASPRCPCCFAPLKRRNLPAESSGLTNLQIESINH